MRLRAALLALPAGADEGMWLFNQFPKDQVKEKYGVEVTDRFLDDLRLASMRIGGGSGSFVSPNGLVFTNYHVVSDCISKVSEGFYAAAESEELACPGLEANILLRIEDVTKAVKDGGAEAQRRHRADRKGVRGKDRQFLHGGEALLG